MGVCKMSGLSLFYKMLVKYDVSKQQRYVRVSGGNEGEYKKRDLWMIELVREGGH